MSLKKLDLTQTELKKFRESSITNHAGKLRNSSWNKSELASRQSSNALTTELRPVPEDLNIKFKQMMLNRKFFDD